MGDITTADLLAVQNNITTAHREDMRALRDDFSEQIGEVRTEQSKQAGDVRALAAIVEERTKPGAAFELSKKQKAAIATAGVTLLGALADGARHLVVWIYAAIKSGQLAR